MKIQANNFALKISIQLIFLVCNHKPATSELKTRFILDSILRPNSAECSGNKLQLYLVTREHFF